MANIGTAAAGKTLIGTGSGVSPTFADIGTNSGLTDRGLLIGQGNGAIVATDGLEDGEIVIGSSSGNPVAASLSAGTGVTITPGPGSITIGLAGGGIAIDTLTPDSGGAVGPDGNGNITMAGSGSITTVAGSNTITTQLTGLTNHNVLVGAGTTTITKVAPSATSGVPLISQGAVSDPAFGTAVVAGGGTGATSFTARGPIIAGSSGTSALESVTPSATSGVPLISQGSSSAPVYGTAVVAGGGTGATTLTGVLTGNGTSAITANAVTNHGVVVAGASNAVGTISVGATGTVLAGSTGAHPAFTATPSLTSVTLGGGTALGNYLEGTYVPVVDGQGSSPTVTYTTQIGKYTRIGNMVFVTITILLASYSGGSGNLIISLPSGLSTNATYDVTGSLYVANLTFSGQITLRFPASFGYAQIATSTSAGASGIVAVTALSATTLIKASGVYFV